MVLGRFGCPAASGKGYSNFCKLYKGGIKKI
jgi:hypothetical protein